MENTDECVRDAYAGQMWCLALMMAASFSAVEIVAHRGSSYSAPENTVAACELAWEEKADAVEVDVHLTKDGRLVVIHDGDTKRTTGMAGVVWQLTLAEIQTLDAGGWKNARYAGERIPSLDECLATGPVARRFFIEVKSGPEAVPELAASIKRAGLSPAQVVVISFHKEVVAAVKRVLPDYQSVWLVGADKDPVTGRPPTLDAVITEAQGILADGLDLSAAWPIDAAFVRKVREAGLGIWVWTVDDPDLARRLKEAGVDGITTNRPGWLRERIF